MPLLLFHHLNVKYLSISQYVLFCLSQLFDAQAEPPAISYLKESVYDINVIFVGIRKKNHGHRPLIQMLSKNYRNITKQFRWRSTPSINVVVKLQDPSAELAWLVEELLKSEAAGQKVHILR